MTGGTPSPSGELARLTRWLLRPSPPAEDRSTACLLAGTVLMTMICGFVILSLVGVGSVTMSHFRMAWTWPQAPALIISVESLRISRRGHYFELRLAASIDGGAVVTGHTVDPIVRYKSWSTPLRPPVPGERIEVRFDPHDPTRMIAVDNLRERWLMLALLALIAGSALFLAKQVVDLAATARLRRRPKLDHG